jgi:hypothetical protein
MAGVQYPVARTAIYFVPLLILVAGGTLQREGRLTGRLGVFRTPFIVLGVILLAQFLSQINITYYNHWSFDAGSRQIAKFLMAQPSHGRRVKISATWTLMPCLNFYREMYGLNNWDPIDGQNGPTKVTGDFVVLDKDSAVLLAPSSSLSTVFVDHVSGGTVAIHTTILGRN